MAAADPAYHPRALRRLVPFMLLCASLCAGGCGDSAQPKPASSSNVTSSSAPAASAAAPAASASAAAEHGNRRKKFGKDEVVVYLDGTPMAVMRNAELPPALEPELVTREESQPTNAPPREREPKPLWPMGDYLEAIGVETDKIKEIHMIGGNRAAIMKGAELIRLGPKLRFAFTRTDEGKPHMDWPTEPYEVSTTVDRFYTVAIYQEKEPPKFNRKQREFQMPDGSAVKGVPYVDKEQSIAGTRIYVDGHLKGAVRRKKLPKEAQVEGQERQFYLGKYLETLGIDVANMKAADFCQKDFVIARLDAAKLRELLPKMVFDMSGEKRRRGKITVEIPVGPDGAKTESVQITAISFVEKLAQADRKVHLPKPPQERK